MAGVMTAVVVVFSVGAKEISEGLLASEVPSGCSSSGEKHGGAWGKALSIEETGGCSDCFARVVFHTFRSSYNIVSSRTTTTDRTIPVG